MNEPSAAPPVISEYKDRTAGLRFFGVLLLLAGILCALLAPLMAFAQIMAARMGAGSTEWRVILQAVLVYSFMAVVLAWLGIGSLLARRWARALLLVLAWGWFAGGLLGLAVIIAMLPQLTQTLQGPGGNLPPGFASIMLTVILVFEGLVLVIVPGVLLLFYRSPHVKATCEARSPERSWTDACPLPVLGLSVWAGVGALMMLMIAVAYNGMFPLFGRLASGWSGALLGLAAAAALALAARAVYGLKSIGWWTVFVFLVLMTTSNFLTLLRMDLAEMYRRMGYSEAIIAQTQHYPFSGTMFAWMALAVLIVAGSYLLYVRKFFHSPIITQDRP